MDDDPVRANLVAIDDKPCRRELERHHAVRPSMAETATHLESFGIYRLLHQVRARANVGRRLTADGFDGVSSADGLACMISMAVTYAEAMDAFVVAGRLREASEVATCQWIR